MIVLDASAGLDFVLQTPAGLRIGQRIHSRRESLHAPHLIDLEFAQVLRRLVREGKVAETRAEYALQDWLDLDIERYPHAVLLPRIWQHRNNLSAYDAAYIALAELLPAPLITRDGRLASAPGHQIRVEVF